MAKRNLIAQMGKSVKNEAFDKKFPNSDEKDADLKKIQNTVAKKQIHAEEEVVNEQPIAEQETKPTGVREKKKSASEIDKLILVEEPEGKSQQISFSIKEEARDKYVKLSKLYSLENKDIDKYEIMRKALYDWIEKNYEKEYKKLI